MWQEAPWATDVTSYAWSPDGHHIFVATAEIYGTGALYDLDLQRREGRQIAAPRKATASNREWLGYRITAIDSRRRVLRVAAVETGERGERVARTLDIPIP
jgi:hypothetical protein